MKLSFKLTTVEIDIAIKLVNNVVLLGVCSVAAVTGIAWVLAPFVLLGSVSGTLGEVTQWLFLLVLSSQVCLLDVYIIAGF